MLWNQILKIPDTVIRWTSCSNPPYYYTEKSYVNLRSRKDPVKDSRTRPSSLWDNPTGRSLVYDLKSVPGLGSTKCYYNSGRYYDWGYVFQPSLSGPEFVLPGWDQSKYSRMMLARIGGEGSSFGDSIAEIDECARTIYDVIESFVQMRHCLRFPPGPKCAKNLRKWFNKHAKARGWKRPQEIAGDILAYNFGIKPLAGQLYDLYTRVGEYPVGFTVKKYSMSQSSSTTYEYANWQTSERYQGRSHVYVQYKTPYSQFVDYGNPLEWAWERVPFSFVVDWIIPVGDYIASFDVLQNVEKVVGVVSERRIKNQFQLGTGYPSIHLDRSGWLSKRTYERKLVSPIVLPSLFRLSGNSSASSLTNALALLVQMHKFK